MTKRKPILSLEYGMLIGKKDVWKFHKMVIMLKILVIFEQIPCFSYVTADQRYMATEFRPRNIGEAKGWFYYFKVVLVFAGWKSMKYCLNAQADEQRNWEVKHQWTKDKKRSKPRPMRPFKRWIAYLVHSHSLYIIQVALPPHFTTSLSHSLHTH